MIDIHCHILPGLDDGPATMEESLAMAQKAVESGIRKVVATPHVLEISAGQPVLPQAVARLNEALGRHHIPLELFCGAEVSYPIAAAHLPGYTMHSGPYVLIEFPHSHLPQQAGLYLFELRAAGYYPIIAHPERNASVLRKPGLLLDLLGEGVFVQLTAASVAGKFGKAVQQCCRFLLERGAVHFLGSDGHSASWRRPQLATGLEAAAEVIGSAEARKLVTSNPEKMLQGQILTEEDDL